MFGGDHAIEQGEQMCENDAFSEVQVEVEYSPIVDADNAVEYAATIPTSYVSAARSGEPRQRGRYSARPFRAPGGGVIDHIGPTPDYTRPHVGHEASTSENPAKLSECTFYNGITKVATPRLEVVTPNGKKTVAEGFRFGMRPGLVVVGGRDAKERLITPSFGDYTLSLTASFRFRPLTVDSKEMFVATMFPQQTFLNQTKNEGQAVLVIHNRTRGIDLAIVDLYEYRDSLGAKPGSLFITDVMGMLERDFRSDLSDRDTIVWEIHVFCSLQSPNHSTVELGGAVTGFGFIDEE